MAITRTTIITCDRCGKLMAKENGDKWIWFDHRKKPFYKISHKIPISCWNKIDDFLLCDDCAEKFRQWMLEKKSTN